MNSISIRSGIIKIGIYAYLTDIFFPQMSRTFAAPLLNVEHPP